ncbi:hypothetical protein [Rubritalea tangerina]|uniref:hypothetical protein n=1 Tax=Rubritalea tangerina TaxID=430798 RepID=UPI00361E1A9C
MRCLSMCGWVFYMMPVSLIDVNGILSVRIAAGMYGVGVGLVWEGGSSVLTLMLHSLIRRWKSHDENSRSMY